MRRLRQKVEVEPNRPVHIQTVRGIGYRLMADRAGFAGSAADGADAASRTDD
jgi:hypothetical protein